MKAIFKGKYGALLLKKTLQDLFKNSYSNKSRKIILEVIIIPFRKGFDDLLSIPSDDIIRIVLDEATRDLTITPEEQYLIDGIQADLQEFTAQIKVPDTRKITKEELQVLLIQQRKFLKELVNKTLTRAKKDDKLSIDERNICKVLLNNVDEIIATKIESFLSLDLEEPHFLMLHKLIGEQFANLTATIMMDIYSEKAIDDKKWNILKISKEFDEEEANREFMHRFQLVLQKLSRFPMDTPTDLISALDSILHAER
ncbi:MAG: hypothetical protein ACFFAJ_05375 [Candidatus Hodarchaeota archaeon]